jgi:hypothetical protein
MNINFFATEISTAPVDGIWTVTFAAPEQNWYFLLRRDVENVMGQRGLNIHYIEYCAASRACYGGLERVQVLADAVKFRLTAHAAERIVMPEFVVSFSQSKAALGAMSSALAHIVEHGRVEIL